MKQVVLLLKEYLNSWPSMQCYEWKLLIDLIVSPKDTLKSLRFISLTESQQLQNWTYDADTPVAGNVRGSSFVFLCLFCWRVSTTPFWRCILCLFPPTKALLGAWAMVLLLLECNRSNFLLKDNFIWPWLMVPIIFDIGGHHWIKICWGRGGKEGGLENR